MKNFNYYLEIVKNQKKTQETLNEDIDIKNELIALLISIGLLSGFGVYKNYTQEKIINIYKNNSNAQQELKKQIEELKQKITPERQKELLKKNYWRMSQGYFKTFKNSDEKKYVELKKIQRELNKKN